MSHARIVPTKIITNIMVLRQGDIMNNYIIKHLPAINKDLYILYKDRDDALGYITSGRRASGGTVHLFSGAYIYSIRTLNSGTHRVPYLVYINRRRQKHYFDFLIYIFFIFFQVFRDYTLYTVLLHSTYL